MMNPHVLFQALQIQHNDTEYSQQKLKLDLLKMDRRLSELEAETNRLLVEIEVQGSFVRESCNSLSA